VPPKASVLLTDEDAPYQGSGKPPPVLSIEPSSTTTISQRGWLWERTLSMASPRKCAWVVARYHHRHKGRPTKSSLLEILCHFLAFSRRRPTLFSSFQLLESSISRSRRSMSCALEARRWFCSSADEPLGVPFPAYPSVGEAASRNFAGVWYGLGVRGSYSVLCATRGPNRAVVAQQSPRPRRCPPPLASLACLHFVDRPSTIPTLPIPQSALYASQ
jgi:hypothetical protein